MGGDLAARRVICPIQPDGWARPMTLVRVYGQKLGQPLHLKDAPSLITRSLRSAELAVTETRDDNPVPGLSGSFPTRMPISSASSFAITRTASAGNADDASTRAISAPERPICMTSSAIPAT